MYMVVLGLVEGSAEVLNMYEGVQAVEGSSWAERAHAEREALSVGTGSKIPWFIHSATANHEPTRIRILYSLEQFKN